MATYWLFKTEPGTYSFENLMKEKRTAWNDVRNFQARNYLRNVAKGDLALIYHSGDDKAVVGVAQAIREAYPDPASPGEKPGDWVQIDIKAVKALKTPVKLAEIKSSAALKEMLLVRQSRLSVTPVTSKQFEIILKLGGVAL